MKDVELTKEEVRTLIVYGIKSAVPERVAAAKEILETVLTAAELQNTLTDKILFCDNCGVQCDETQVTSCGNCGHMLKEATVLTGYFTKEHANILRNTQ